MQVVLEAQEGPRGLKLNTHDIEYSTGDEFELVPIADVHAGSSNCDLDLFDDVLDSVAANPNARVILGGDLIESITPRDPRWSAGGIDPNWITLANLDRLCDVYVEKMAAKLSRISGQIIAATDGNHEAKAGSHYSTNLTARIMDAIGRPDAYVGWACLTRIVFTHKTRGRSLPVRIFHSHGWQAGRQEGGKVNEIRRLLAYVEADIYLQGHSHSKWVIPQTRLSTNGRFTKLTAHEVFTAHTGSFLRTLQQDHVGYAETAGYPPTSTGVVRFKLRPEEDHVNIEAVI